MKRTVALCLITALCACSSLPSLPALPQAQEDKAFQQRMDKWVGRSADELVVANGPPTNVFMLDSGRRVYEYYRDRMVTSNGESWLRTAKKHVSAKQPQPVSVQNLQNLPTADTVSLPQLQNMSPPQVANVDLTTSGLRARPPHSKYVCALLFNVNADNIIENWSLEGEKCD